VSLCVYCRVPLPAGYQGDRECCRRRPRAPDQDTMCVEEKRLLGTEPVTRNYEGGERNERWGSVPASYPLVNQRRLR